MGQIISLLGRFVRAKGTNSNNILNEEKLKSYVFLEDFEKLKILSDVKIDFEKESVKLFYPGCGCDVLFPLFYLERLFPNVKEVKMLYLDTVKNLDLIKTILDDIGISFSANKNKIMFYWKGIMFSLNFVVGDVDNFLEKVRGFDIYFERAFRIMRDQIDLYELRVIGGLNYGGVIISDTGFLKNKLQRIEVSADLSTYKEMFIGQKL